MVLPGVRPLVNAVPVARYHARPGIVFVPFSDAPPLEYGLIWRSDGHTARVRAFAQALCRITPDLPR
ncbi:hypothetical protein ACH347_34365 [Saccharopolyspora sp. 5N102]|uniref:hypothetical protein n=1 Tax=Saccharopolyspora sp. 5N102 TaxID=3375155 RepID=UPI00379F3D8C